MIILLSPAKSLDFESKGSDLYTEPVYTEEANTLINSLKKKSKPALKKLMSISDKLADLNYQRYQTFQEESNTDNSKSAIYAFRGDVYIGLAIDDFNKTEIKRAQKSIRILSGLYGYLRPLDLIQPYRLEMGTKLKVRRKNNLYEFWGNKITDQINDDLIDQKSEYIINLASKEYFKSVNPKEVNGKIYNIHFKENKNGTLKFVSFNAKKARGMMARWIVKENIKTPDQMVHFDVDRYKFEPSLSSEYDFTFIR